MIRGRYSTYIPRKDQGIEYEIQSTFLDLSGPIKRDLARRWTFPKGLLMLNSRMTKTMEARSLLDMRLISDVNAFLPLVEDGFLAGSIEKHAFLGLLVKKTKKKTDCRYLMACLNIGFAIWVY